MSFEVISEAASFGGTQGYYKHAAETTKCDMRFSVYTPPQAKNGKVPVVWYLSGLTCTEDNVTVKAGFQRMAAELGLMIICPDTSPRGEGVPNVEEYDFGQGAGFYVNATEAPWSEHFHMYDYVVRELPQVIAANFKAADMDRQGITGHSMGGHGALTLFLRNQGQYKSVSAFAPIVSPLNCPWGQKALSGYLGDDKAAWAEHDTCALVRKYGDTGVTFLVDQGLGDNFLEEQLKPSLLKEACKEVGQDLMLRQHDDYDHSYFFIATFMEDHLKHHAKALS